MPLTQVDQGLLSSTAQYTGFKNRIINGAMVIDQRNAGAALTVNSTSAFYPVDRFFAEGQSADGVFTVQQSTTAPAGFKNSVVITTTTADASIGATQYYLFTQPIEGFNVADLGFGASGAKTITLSFWARSSLTGTFGGSVLNSAQDRAYPYSYTINAANTWEFKTVTITGDTTGTWLTNNGVGLLVRWSIGCGSTYLGTAGAWTGSIKLGATGQTNLISTLSANLYITGAQVEVGSTATSFDYRPYGTELALCQRYYEKSFDIGTAPAASVSGQGANTDTGAIAYTTSAARSPAQSFKVTKRTTPTVTLYAPSGYGGGTGGNNAVIYIGGSWYNWTGATLTLCQANFWLDGGTPATVTNGNSYLMSTGWAASSEL